MKKISMTALSTLLTLVLCTAQANYARAEEAAKGAQTPAWERVDVTEGITTYRREIPGTNIVAFRGEAEIEDSVYRVATVIEDVKSEIEWMADLAESYEIAKKMETERWEYNRTSTPWPLQDRDFVVHTLISVDRGPNPIITIKMKSVEHPDKPKVKGVVRGDVVDSTTIIKSLGPKKTWFACEILADPKGAIPTWVVNFFQKGWPLDTIRGLRRQLKKPGIAENPHVRKLIESGA